MSEQGHVFLDVHSRPFMVKKWGGDLWLFYWHKDNHWVSLRSMTEMEFRTIPSNLTQAEQDLYHEAQKRWEEPHE
jgi:hypothetical protein